MIVRTVSMFRLVSLMCLCTLLLPAQASTRKVHELVLSGTYRDLAESGFSIMSLASGGGMGKVKPFYDLVADIGKLEKAGGEVLVDLSSPSLGLNGPQLVELARAFTSLRNAGVKTTAYLENASMSHYRVAVLCDRIFMADMGTMDFKAPSMNTMFFRGVMDLLGVQVQVTRCGDFKGAVEPFMLEKMSSHLKQHYLQLLRDMNDGVVSRISTRRQIDKKKVRDLQRQRLISASEARQARLVDEVVPWRGARQLISGDDVAFERVGKAKKKSGFSIMSLLSGGKKKADKKLEEPSYVVLHLQGAIEDGREASAGSIVSGPTVARVRKLMNDDLVEGVVVRVNSPGGSATASEAILLALRDLAKTKPVVVSMGNLAASGGYYISMIGCPILTERETITGSIGVFGLRPNLTEIAEAAGVHEEVVGLDETAAAMDSFFRPASEHELSRRQSLVNAVYTRFQDRILEVRKGLTREQLLKIAGGRVWSGARAKELGLVDAIGGLDDAIVRIEKKNGASLPVVHLPRPSGSPFGALGSLLGVMVRQAAPELELLGHAGFRLAEPIRILADALRHRGSFRVWMLAPAELSIRW